MEKCVKFLIPDGVKMIADAWPVNFIYCIIHNCTLMMYLKVINYLIQLIEVVFIETGSSILNLD